MPGPSSLREKQAGLVSVQWPSYHGCLKRWLPRWFPHENRASSFTKLVTVLGTMSLAGPRVQIEDFNLDGWIVRC